MANKKNKANNKVTKEMVIENNIGLVEVLYYIFKGQVLEMDIKEFCLKYEVYQTKEDVDIVIKKLINSNIIKINKLVNTNNNVIVAKAPIYRYFREIGKTTRYSTETVTRNSYINFIVTKTLNLKANSIKELAELIEEKSTLLSLKRNVSSCTKIFEKKINSYGVMALEDAYIREEKRKRNLKNIEKVEVISKDCMIGETLQTLRERDIYVVENKTEYKVLIIDNNTDFRLSSLSKKIGLVLRVFAQQLEIQKNLDIFVYMKSNVAKEKLKNNFINRLADGKVKVNIDKSINKELEGTQLTMEYELKNVNGDVYVLENVYTYNTIQNMQIRLINTDISNKHNSDFKSLRLVESKKGLKEKSIREELLAELRAKGLLIESSNELDDI